MLKYRRRNYRFVNRIDSLIVISLLQSGIMESSIGIGGKLDAIAGTKTKALL